MSAKCWVVTTFSRHLVFDLLFYERKDFPLMGDSDAYVRRNEQDGFLIAGVPNPLSLNPSLFPLFPIPYNCVAERNITGTASFRNSLLIILNVAGDGCVYN